MKKERIALWDNLRFLLVVLLVVGHFADEYASESNIYQRIFLYIYSFHIPLYFFIAGLFHKNEKVAERVLGWIGMAYFYKLSISLLRLGFSKTPDFDVLKTGSIAWIAVAMAAFVGFTYLFRNLNMYYVLLLAMGLALFVGYDKNLGDLLVLRRILTFYPFYLMGVGMERAKLEEFFDRKKVRIAGLVILAVAVVVCLVCSKYNYEVFRKLFTGKNNFEAIFDKKYKYGAVYRFFAFLFTVIMGGAVMAVVPNKRIRMITANGTGIRTLQVYFWHRLVLQVLSYLKMHEKICSMGIVGKMAWLLIAVVIAFVLSHEIFEFPLDYIMKGPEKIKKKA